MSFQAGLQPTVYQQPPLSNGTHNATVYPTYASVECDGYEYIATINGRMNVPDTGIPGYVRVSDDSVNIYWS